MKEDADLAALVVIGVVLALTLPGGAEVPTVPSPAPEASDDGPAALGDDWVRAVHIVSYSDTGLTAPGFVDAVRRAKTDGATHVVVHPVLLADDVDSPLIARKPDSPTNESLIGGMQAADREGAATIIQPLVDIEDNYPGAFEPWDPEAFFTTYEQRVAEWADIGAEHGADAIIAQGAEAGGHRGMFLTDSIAGQPGTFALVPQVVDAVRVPVIAW